MVQWKVRRLSMPMPTPRRTRTPTADPMVAFGQMPEPSEVFVRSLGAPPAWRTAAGAACHWAILLTDVEPALDAFFLMRSPSATGRAAQLVRVNQASPTAMGTPPTVAN